MRLYVALQRCFVASDLSSPKPIKIRVFQRCFLINWWILTFHEIFLKIRPFIHPKSSKFQKKPERKTSIKSSKIQNGALAHVMLFQPDRRFIYVFLVKHQLWIFEMIFCFWGKSTQTETLQDAAEWHQNKKTWRIAKNNQRPLSGLL